LIEIDKDRLLYLVKKTRENSNIDMEDIQKGIIFTDYINNNNKHILLIQMLETGREKKAMVNFYIDNEIAGMFKFKDMFWIEDRPSKNFRKKLVEIFQIKEEELKDTVNLIYKTLYSTYDKWINRDTDDDKLEAEEVLTEEEQKQIDDLLKNKDFFEIIKKKMGLWCQGNDMQKVFLYAISFGTYLKNPPLIGIIGNSSSGKSHLVKSVKKLFKKDSWEVLASSSSKGFYYDERDWEGQRLFLLEIQGLNDENMVLLRTWWSEGNDMNLTHITVDKNSAGQMTGAKKTLKKPPFGIFTSAVPEVENQMSTRIWRVHADDSVKQHKRIKDMVAEDARFDSDLDMDEGIPMKIFHHLEENLITDVNIIVPFAHTINLRNYKYSRANRDIKKLYDAIKCFALISQKRRLLFEVEGKKYLLAEYEDYENFIKYGGLIFSNTVKDIDDDMRRSINIFIENINVGIMNLSISAMARALGVNNRPKVKRILDELYNKNILSKHKGDRNSWVYELTTDGKLSFSNQLENVTTEVTTELSSLEHIQLVQELKSEFSCKISEKSIEGIDILDMTYEEVKKVINIKYPLYTIENLPTE